MALPMIEIDNVSKEYRLGAIGGTTLNAEIQTKIAKLRGQSDRNIRKVRNTMLKKIYKKILPYLKDREEKGLSMTMEERAFLAEMREQS